ncbi:hypothetical protein [Streptomyces erythrochromogenes]|uniref:hypothetical protein n=1 Tax=Streptomyces erythrochromogenes TaxID=285574 RepID=UPI0034107EA8
MPQIRPGRTRSKRNNRRVLLLSTMKPQDFNVRPAEPKSIACPDCHVWRRIMGDTDLKIREHCVSDCRAKKDEEHVICPGSNTVVVINIDVKQWQAKQDRLLRDAMPSENRRAAQQFYKPLPAPAAPVSRIKAETTLETTRQSYLAHRQGCIRCVGGQHCQDGATLARRYVLAVQEETARCEARDELERQKQRTARKMTAPTMRKAQWAKRGGQAVENANNSCSERMAGSVSEFRGPGLPLLPQDVKRHDRRQAELGKQYAERSSAPSAA